MSPESLDTLRIGDRLAGGWVVVDTKYAKEGAIGIHNDDPAFEERLRRALETYAYEVKRRQFGPWTKEELQEMEQRHQRERTFNLPLDSSTF